MLGFLVRLRRDLGLEKTLLRQHVADRPLDDEDLLHVERLPELEPLLELDQAVLDRRPREYFVVLVGHRRERGALDDLDDEDLAARGAVAGHRRAVLDLHDDVRKQPHVPKDAKGIDELGFVEGVADLDPERLDQRPVAHADVPLRDDLLDRSGLGLGPGIRGGRQRGEDHRRDNDRSRQAHRIAISRRPPRLRPSPGSTPGGPPRPAWHPGRPHIVLRDRRLRRAPKAAESPQNRQDSVSEPAAGRAVASSTGLRKATASPSR